MALTNTQRKKLKQNRKASPPGYFNAATKTTSAIVGATEDAIILTSASGRQEAAAYFDRLASTNPSTDDGDAITGRAAKQQQENIDAALKELEPVIESFETFRDELTRSGSTEKVFAEGMQPLLHSINSGVSAMRVRIGAFRFLRKFSVFAEAKYGGKVTDDKRKEWRSWKRILVTYP